MQYGGCHGRKRDAPNLNTKIKTKADSQFDWQTKASLSNLKKMRKKNTLKATQTLLVECLAHIDY